MSHEIGLLDKVVTAMGDSRAWHNLDTQFDFTIMDRRQIAEVMNLLHSMEVSQLSRSDSGELIKDLYGVFSGLTGECINQISEPERLVQPQGFMNWALDTVDMLNARVVSGGTLKNTRHAFICAELPDALIDLGGGDTIKKFMFFGISWDGSYPIVCMLNDIRTVCWNTTPSLEAIDKARDNRIFYQKRHGTLGYSESVHCAKQVQQLGEERRKKAQAVLNKLTTTKFDLASPVDLNRFAAIMAEGGKVLDRILDISSFDQGASLLDKCINATIDSQAWTAVKTTQLNNIAGRIVLETINGLGSDLPSASGTLWGMLNGYTTWADHHSGRGEGADERRTENVIFGGYTKEKQNAMLLLSAIANTGNSDTIQVN